VNAKVERWYTWHWDYCEERDTSMPLVRIQRWRRGSLLTVYLFEGECDMQWWFYGPWHLAIGFGYPKRGARDSK
jgi:hypothetical protein